MGNAAQQHRIISFGLLFHNCVQQCLIVTHHIVHHVFIVQCLEMCTGTINFRLFYRGDVIELHGIQCAFGFSNKVDVLDCALIERNRPVGIVFSNRRGNIEPIRQLYIDCHITVRIKERLEQSKQECRNKNKAQAPHKGKPELEL